MNHDSPYHQAAKPGYQYKIVSISWLGNSGWIRQLELKLAEASEDGWRPILYSDGGQQNTVIMERPNEIG